MLRKKLKKILTISMALSMILCTNTFATPIDLVNSTESVATDTLTKSEGTDYFDDEDTNVWEDGQITERVDVTVQRESQFEVTIPKDIVLNGETGQANYIVNAKGDIAGDQAILVTPEENFTLNEDGGKTITANIIQYDTEYTHNELLGNGTDYNGKIISPLTAGNWIGSFYFNIDFKDNYISNLYYLEYETNENTEKKTFKDVNELKQFTSNNDELKSVKLIMKKTSEIQDLSNIFENNINLTEVDLSEININSVSSFNNIFHNSNNIKTVHVKHNFYEKYNNLDSILNINKNNVNIIDTNEDVHTYTSKIIAPICVEEGYTSHTCIHCGKNYITDKVPAIGYHNTDGTKSIAWGEPSMWSFTKSGSYYKSINHAKNSTGSVTFTINMPTAGKIRLYYSISSNYTGTYRDRGAIYLDGALMGSYYGVESGTLEWEVSAGTHTLKASYAKDSLDDTAKPTNDTFTVMPYAPTVAACSYCGFIAQ